MDDKIARLLEREGTGISWADLTFNPWIGCQKVSPACDNCYAEDLATARLGVAWGPGAPRRRTAPGNWGKPLRWQRLAAEAGVRLKVFCASLADIMDNAVDDQWRADLGATIIATPSLDWMILTKRIGNAEAMLAAMFPDRVPPNVALGVSIPNQTEADRDVPRALLVKKRLGVRRLFLSMEPLLGPVDLEQIYLRRDGQRPSDLSNHLGDYVRPLAGAFSDSPVVDLVIVGGESGSDARPMHPDWARSLRDQCASAGVPFHFKQWGEWRETDGPKTHTANRAMRKGTHWLTRDGILHPGDTNFSIYHEYRVARLGVKRAGRLLDGIEHSEHFND